MSFPPQFEAPNPEELHELLPSYDVLAFIAKGGMGAVYKAHQKSLERNVAIKILPREFGEDMEFRKRFEDEAKAMAKLNHPNLISVYNFGEVDHMLYIVMEFVDGKSLHHSAHGKAIEQREVARLVTGICEGLAHAHEAGILHRDIKPANILLDGKKRPKIGDFGLARFAEETEGEGIIFGTPDYTAPEVTKSPGAVDTRSDVFSTGVILYELLTGKLPEKNYVPASQIEDVDPRFDKIVRRATHPSPMLRFADGEAMAKDLKQLRDTLDKQVPGIMATPPAKVAAPPSGPTPAPATVPVPLTGPAPTPATMETPAVALPNAPGAPEVQIKIGTNWSLLRNLVIIVLLLVAIYGMYTVYQQQKKKLEEDKLVQQQREDQAKQQEIRRLLNEKKARERRAALEASRPKAPPVIPEPEPETPMEALERLKPALTTGERTEYPPGTLVRGTSRFFFVENKLSWPRAAAYAEEYGGHLATCLNEGEQNWLASKIPGNTTIWLGGGATGRTAWGWVDGSPWNLRKPSITTGNSATLSDLGSIRSQPGGRKFPFFIQWRNDGTNPGNLKAQFTRLKATLETPDPIYPPGVLSFENRRYLLIEKPATWEDANAVAKGTHGHLAVPSEPSEGDYLRRLISSNLDEKSGAWIGGRHNGRSWTWITGEPWAFASWAPGSPDGTKEIDSAVRLVAGENGGWDDSNPRDEEVASAFVIEWSEDRGNTRPVAIKSGAGDWANLRTAAQKKIQILEARFTEKLMENGTSLKWDLNFWHRGLRDNDKRTYEPAVKGIKAKVGPDGSIAIRTNEISKLPLPPRGQDVVRRHLQAQQKHKDDLQAQANWIRMDYVKSLQSKKDASEDGGKSNEMRAIQNEIDACGESGRTFLEHLGSGILRSLDSPRQAP
ncbi:MAG: protein kinase [Roseibacillus sp.]|nr:protein kinase [Roseibacillus sp.]